MPTELRKIRHTEAVRDRNAAIRPALPGRKIDEDPLSIGRRSPDVPACLDARRLADPRYLTPRPIWLVVRIVTVPSGDCPSRAANRARTRSCVSAGSTLIPGP